MQIYVFPEHYPYFCFNFINRNDIVCGRRPPFIDFLQTHDMKLIADSGSTKTDWCITDGGTIVYEFGGQGMNPFQQTTDTIDTIICQAAEDCRMYKKDIDEIYFYGAGCREEMQPVMTRILGSRFTGTNRIEVNTDLLAAARALLGNKKGIACILGTGSNSCLYDGRKIIKNIPPLGYILGDEGSGAVLGKMFVNALFKGRLPESIKNAFVEESGLELPDVISRVYRQSEANRFLASLSPFIHSHLSNDGVRRIVIDNFRNFLNRNINRYGQHETTVNAIGSIALYYKSEFAEAARLEGFRLGVVTKSPVQGLVSYHEQSSK